MTVKNLQPHAHDLGLALLRLTLAVVFVYHGGQKLFGWFGGPGIEGFAGFLGTLGVPLPTLNAYLAGGAELFGGLALLTGLGARVLSAPLAFTMLVAALTAHSGFDARSGGMESPLTLFAAVAAVGLVGPGRWTLPGLVTRLRGGEAAVGEGEGAGSSHRIAVGV